jgi:hypothetical protein
MSLEPPWFPMHPIALVHEAARLLHEGELSHRQIAARLGVSRGTVGAIASGRRSLFGREKRLDLPSEPTTPPTRCPQCGYRVHMPCHICRIRAHKTSQQLLQILARQQPSPPVRSNQKPERVYFRAS